MADLLQQSVKRITVETAWLPPIVIEDPFGPPPPAGSTSSRVGSILKPHITVETALGPISSSPWGLPTQNWPLLKTLVIGVSVFGASMFAFSMINRKLKSRRTP